jgi:hypothetical protein
MRCPDCNKFVSFDQQDPEVDAAVGNSEITGSVRLVLACAECGGELKEANIDFSADIDHTCEGKDVSTEELDFEIVSEMSENTDRYEDKDRKGRKIKSYRYMKHYYGAELTFEVKCLGCEEEFEVTASVEEQASGFEEL